MEFNTDFFAGIIEAGLKELKYPQSAPRLFEPVTYTLEGGGKRLRPCLALAAFAACGGTEPAKALPQALAIEMYHNFTLLHDDVMDKADIRRGRPTVHRRWNDNVAILSGDAMFTYAVQLMAQCPSDKLPKAMETFLTTAMEVTEGQQLDMEFEHRMNVTVPEYLEMIRLKTSVLLACACAVGAMMAGASEDDVRSFYDYGVNLGLAFQLRDDWLDTFGDPAVFGKEIGGDIRNRKKTWLLITALEEDGDNTRSILSEDLDDEELVRQIRQVYDSLSLNRRCNELADRYSAKAIESLGMVTMDQRAKEYLTSLAVQASTRNH